MLHWRVGFLGANVVRVSTSAAAALSLLLLGGGGGGGGGGARGRGLGLGLGLLALFSPPPTGASSSACAFVIATPPRLEKLREQGQRTARWAPLSGSAASAPPASSLAHPSSVLDSRPSQGNRRALSSSSSSMREEEERVHVRRSACGEKVYISLWCREPGSAVCGQKVCINLERGAHESLEKCLERLAISYQKKVHGKAFSSSKRSSKLRKKGDDGGGGFRSQEPPPPLPPPPRNLRAFLTRRDGDHLLLEASHKLTNQEGFFPESGGRGTTERDAEVDPSSEGRACHLLISDQVEEGREQEPHLFRESSSAKLYPVWVNAPTIFSLSTLPSASLPVVGCDLVGHCIGEGFTRVEWEWTRSRPTEGGGTTSEVVSKEKNYRPAPEDAGATLSLKCTPLDDALGRKGWPESLALDEPVAPHSPALLSLRGGRHARSAGNTFRVVCWNVLADRFCVGEDADRLYHYCPQKWRERDYRTQLILAELRGYEADLLALQEVDARMFETALEPLLKLDGYSGNFLRKDSPTVADAGDDGKGKGASGIQGAGGPTDGSAIFFREDAFELVGSEELSFREIVPSLSSFSKLWDAYPHLLDIVKEKLTTVALISILRFKTRTQAGDHRERYLLVSNTHLFFHPEADHIRLMQCVALVEEVRRIRDGIRKEHGEEVDVNLCLCGDYNSDRFSGAARYLLGETILPSDPVWETVPVFQWRKRYYQLDGDQEEEGRQESEEQIPSQIAVTDYLPQLRLDTPLVSACGVPPWTNFTPHFTDVLDWIFTEQGTFDVEYSGTIPTESAMRETTVGIPCEGWPSDHASLVCDLRQAVVPSAGRFDHQNHRDS